LISIWPVCSMLLLAAVDADEGAQGFDRRIFQDGVGGLLLQLLAMRS
jgi:hypothetical protein